MSVLNLGLAHVATRRGDLYPWAEKAVANDSSMQIVWHVTKEVEGERQQGAEDVVVLRWKLAPLGIVKSGENKVLLEHRCEFKSFQPFLLFISSYFTYNVYVDNAGRE